MLVRPQAIWRRARLGAPAVLAACAALASVPALAAGADRFASPGSTVTSGACPASAPCALAAAVSGASAGDSVDVEPGTYTLTQALTPKVAIDLHGVAGQPAPVIQAPASLGGSFAVGLSGGSIERVDISTAADHQAALELAGATGDDLVLTDTGAPHDSVDGAVELSTPKAPAPASVLRDTVVWSEGAKMPAVNFAPSLDGLANPNPTATSATANQAASDADLVNVTAIATGAGAAAVVANSNSGPVSLVDVIASGASQDLLGATGTSSSLSVAYSDFRPASSTAYTDAGGNVTSAPVFVNPAGGDFHEVATSPTVDAGVTTPLSGSSDPDGNLRTLGSAPDIGAYEFVPGSTPLGPGGTLGEPFGGADGGAGAAGLLPGSNLPLPVPYHSVDVAPIQGRVLVRVPGSKVFTVLGAGQQLPVGSTIDASAGTVALTSARDTKGTPQTGHFWGGQFRVRQTGGAGNLVTQLSLTGELSGCTSARAAAPALLQNIGQLQNVGIAASAKHAPQTRLLWGSDNHGHFSTRGNNALATVRGTVWMMKDTCAGTVTQVMKGKVSVRDLRTGRSFLVTAGHQRLVRAGR